MKTKAGIEKDIINISLKIHREFPELSKYIAEMPEKQSGKTFNLIRTKDFKDHYNSLLGLLSEYAKTHVAKNDKKIETSNTKGYPLYPSSDDIYNQDREEQDLNPEDITKNKTPNEKVGSSNEKSFKEDMSGDDLDVPGSELDDQQESVGSEDEENNYYSLGGDDHNNLEEDHQ